MPDPSRTPFRPTPLHLRTPVPTDIEVAQEATLKPISSLSAEIGIHEAELERYGETKAKVRLGVLDRLQGVADGKYVVVTAKLLWSRKRDTSSIDSPASRRSLAAECLKMCTPASGRPAFARYRRRFM